MPSFHCRHVMHELDLWHAASIASYFSMALGLSSACVTAARGKPNSSCVVSWCLGLGMW